MGYKDRIKKKQVPLLFLYLLNEHLSSLTNNRRLIKHGAKMKRNIWLMLGILGCLSFGATQTQAASCDAPYIEFTNTGVANDQTDNFCVPLKSDSSVKHLSNGNFKAECTPSADDQTQCEGVSAAGGNTGPGASITKYAASATTVDTNQNFTIDWKVSGAELCKVTSNPSVSPTSVTGMTALANGFYRLNNGVTSGKFAYNIFNPSTTTNKSYQFSMICYAEDGNSTKRTQTVVVRKNPGTQAPAGCEALKSALIAAGRSDLLPNPPSGLFRDSEARTFTQVFKDNRQTVTYPDAGFNYIVDIPAPSYGKFMAVDLKPVVGKYYRFSSIEATINSFSIIRNPGPFGNPTNGTSYWSISPCPGDFRKPVAANDPILSTDPSLHPSCRKGPGSNNKLTYALNPPSDLSGVCSLSGASNQTFFWNAIMADPNQTINSSNNTCDLSGRTTCHNNISHGEV